MAVKDVAGAMELAATAARHDLDVATRRPSIFRLIVRGQYLELGNCVHVQHDVLRAVRPGVDVRRAVDREVVLVGAGPVYVNVAEAPRSGDREIAGVDDTRY